MKLDRAQTLLIGASSILVILCSGVAQAYDAEFDYNSDGVVDAADTAMIKAAFNSGEGDYEFDPIFDHDGDGHITMADISLAFLAVTGE